MSYHDSTDHDEEKVSAPPIIYTLDPYSGLAFIFPENNRLEMTSVIIDDAWSEAPEVWSKLPITLEIYLHMHRVIEALNSTDQKNLIAVVFPLFIQQMECVETDDPKSSRPPLKSLSNKDLKRKTFYDKIDEAIKTINVGHQRLDIEDYLKKNTLKAFSRLSFAHRTLGFIAHVYPPRDYQSSHSKKEKPPALMPLHFEFRKPVSRHSDDPENGSLVRFRCPSIINPNKNLPLALEEIEKRMEEISPKEGKLPASNFTIYQLLTSHSPFQDQTNTALTIIEEAHRLNAKTPELPRLFVFNIPMNLHSHPLYYSDDKAKQLLIMADLAFIYRMAEWKPSEATRDPRDPTNHIEETKKAYQIWLSGRDNKKSFEDLLSSIKTTKGFINNWSGKSATEDSPSDLVFKAFIRLYNTAFNGIEPENSTDKNDQKWYGLPVQALFSALNQRHLIGCKSANERFFLVEGLTQCLQAFLYGSMQPKLQAKLSTLFSAYLDSGHADAAYTFTQGLIYFHNRYNAYGCAMAPSLIDTGTPKAEIYPNGILPSSTNKFVPPGYTNIAQASVSEFQAHSELPKRVKAIIRSRGVSKGSAPFSGPPSPESTETSPGTAAGAGAGGSLPLKKINPALMVPIQFTVSGEEGTGIDSKKAPHKDDLDSPSKMASLFLGPALEAPSDVPSKSPNELGARSDTASEPTPS